MNISYVAVVSALFLFLFSSPSVANKAVEDDFVTDGTSTTDADYFGSSTANAVEINANSIGLVSGSSGRHMHALFPTQTLTHVGDMLKVHVTFTTPTTIASGNEDLRIGLFDHLERTAMDQLGQNTSFSSTSPNPLYNDLPGYRLELDVESADPATDLDIRKSSPSKTGRLMSTSDGFTALSSGPDAGYVFAADTSYTVIFTFQALTGNEMNITTDFIGPSGNPITHTATDDMPYSYSFGMLALNASSGAFGTSNAVGAPDNGIDITLFTVELIPTANPVETVTPFTPQEPLDPNAPRKVDDDFATDGTAQTDASYYGSSGSSAIEINANSVGLVSGSSSRQIHALFPTQSLVNPGDQLVASVTFTTPATVAATNEDLRLGLFDPLDRTGPTQLGQNTSYSSGSPNADFQELPGYFFEVDVENADATTDFEIRRHNIGQDPIATTGRLLATTTANTGNPEIPFTHLTGSSGPDVGYAIAANTSYTIDMTAERTDMDGLEISITLSNADTATEIGSLTLTDESPASFDFGMLAMGSSSDAFGSSNTAGVADNGIDITKFTLDLFKAEIDIPGSSGTAVVVDDNLADDGTTNLDAEYYTSSNGNAIEFNANSIGLVSGGSGRSIHALFDKQTLEQAGDVLRTSITFVTPATVATAGEEFRFGVFDHLDRDTPTQLRRNTSFSSSSPNPDFSGLPGFYMEMDVETTSLQSDIEIRRSDPSTTGRLLVTTGGFTSLGNGPDLGYAIEAETEYTMFIEIERTADDTLDITGILFGRTFTVTDAAPESFDFGMLAMHATGGAFGSSNSPNQPDNGIDITNVKVEFIRTAPVADDFSDPATIAAAADSYFGSTGASAIEFNADSVGLVSGPSGRQIHSLFDTQTLANTGDVMEVSIDFTMPATVASTNEDLRFGVFDHLDRNGPTQLGQNTSFSSGSPNADYSGLPGFFVELDIESADTTTDLQIRRSNPSTSGRLLTTTSGFTELGNSDDIGYSFAPGTSYTIDLTLERTDMDGLDVTAEFQGSLFKVTDAMPVSFDFGMLAFYASSGAVGSSNSAGDPDNGIDITRVSVNYTPFFEVEEVDIPVIVPPTGDHPDVEIIPTIPGDDDDDDVNTDPIDDSGSSGGPSMSANPIAALPGAYLILLTEDEPLTEAEKVAQYFGLDPNAKPWENFDLTDWALDTPNADNGPIMDGEGNVFGNGDGFSARTQDFNFAAGAQFPGSEPFFFTGSDGAMVFKVTVFGARTSQNTSYVRSELREMLRAGDENIATQGPGPNNWRLGYTPNESMNNYGGVGGSLTATLSVDQVTTTGVSNQVGRVIIGQIHGGVNEPIRLYYRKLPGNSKGSIYAASETFSGANLPIMDIIGSASSTAEDPEDGIALGELFSYEINQEAGTIEVIIRRGDKDGEIIGTTVIDLVANNSGYDVEGAWMYFKAGAYIQDNTGWANDFAQVRFYRLDNTH